MRRFLLVLMIIPLLLLAGCGKSEENVPTAAAPENTATVPQSTEETAEPVPGDVVPEQKEAVAANPVMTEPTPSEPITAEAAATEGVTAPQVSDSVQQDAEGNPVYTVTFDKLPQNLAELQAMPESALLEPQYTAALTIAALCIYPTNQEACLEMLQYLQGPQEITTYNKQFLADRFRDQDYVPRSYFAGAVPENDYTPTEPYTIIFFENPYSRTNINDGYLTLWVNSGGADSPRQISLRNKPSTGEWFLWEQFVLTGIRTPVSKDPWA